MTLTFQSAKDLILNLIDGSTDLGESLKNSEQIDQILGFFVQEIEASIPRDGQSHLITQTWKGLNPQILQTTYREFFDIYTSLESRELEWADLGAAYGRLGLFLFFMNPNVKFTGYEVLPERFNEAIRVYKSWGLVNQVMYQMDLKSEKFQLPYFRNYFIYDFGETDLMSKIVCAIQKWATHKPVTVVARGRKIRNLIDREHPWLSQVKTPLHRDTYSIYFSQ